MIWMSHELKRPTM